MSQAEREEPLVPALEPEETAENEEHGALGGHHGDGDGENFERRAEKFLELDARPYGDEEKPEKEALERLDVRLQLVPEFGVREDDPGQERAEGGRKTDEKHQQRGGRDDQERESRVHLSHARPMDEPESRPSQIDSD